MQTSYTDILLKGVNNCNDLTIKDIPLVVNTVDASYPLAFMDFEEEDMVGLNYTAEDGTEKFVVINKKYIVDIQVLYQQDIDILFEQDTPQTDTMYQ